jgi:hypothetical protein
VGTLIEGQQKEYTDGKGMWLHEPTWRKTISFLAFTCCICMHFQIMVHGSRESSDYLGREIKRSIFVFVQVMMQHRGWGKKVAVENAGCQELLRCQLQLLH